MATRANLTRANKTNQRIKSTFRANSYCCLKMTKLVQWLCFGVLFLSLWISLVTRRIKHQLLEEYSTVIIFLPAILIILFGVYAAAVVLWRVYTFNNCEDAAKELKRQIEEAKTDLKSRGFQFKEDET